MPGVVAFFAHLANASKDPQWMEKAELGRQYLAAQSSRNAERVGAGLYTGFAGLGATFMSVMSVDPNVAGWSRSARKAASEVAIRAKHIDDGAEWSTSNDIISGTAGIGLFLQQAALKWHDTSLADLSLKAGRRLLKTAVPAEGGLMWFPAGTSGANYPNFSHGTAGVAYFLATLYSTSKDQAFLDGAIAGAKYLDAVSTLRSGGRAIFHVTGGGEDRFYLSWCHGPAGTARLFERLFMITGEEKWRVWVDELTQWVLTSGAPEQPSAGYWNNISQCCGNVGIGQYCIDLFRHRRPPAAAALDALRARVLKNTMSRATDDEQGLRWVQAENRTQPTNLVAQTGFMQGAAGVGMFLLHLDAFSRKAPGPPAWPDSPWG
jgi:lantibiotic modifying enzyme